MKEYRDLFLAESAKHLARIEELLDGSGPPPRGSVVEAIFREVHSYKGMAGTMRFEAMAKLAHRAEDFLEALRAGGALDDPAREFLVRCLDRLARMRDDVAAGGGGELEWADLFGEAIPAKPSVGPVADVARVESPRVDPPGGLRVTILIDPDCPTPSARAFLVVKRFMEFVPSLSSEPSAESLLAGEKADRVRLILPGTSRAEVADVYATLTEVAGLAFEEERKPVAAPASPVAEPRSMLPETVEIEAASLDSMVDLVGELTMMSARIRDLAANLESDGLREESRRLDGMVRNLDDSVMALRCFPFSTIAARLRRFVREEGEKLGKKARLSVSGGQIGVDKAVMGRLSGPLTHLLRNALDHGMESPAERSSAGKPEEGNIDIALERGRNTLRLVVSDDGRGVDRSAVGRVAIERGLATAAEVSALSDEKLLAYLFLPGFSTRAGVGELSGRGVGLDAVASEIAAMGGEIRLSSSAGRGARFELILPLSPAIAPVLTLEAGGMALALPVFAVEGAFEADFASVRNEGGAERLIRGEESIPLRYLSDVLGAGGRPDPGRFAVVVIGRGEGRLCLAADRLIREEHLFIKPFRGIWEGLAGVSGYSVTGDGRIVYLLDPAALVG